MAVDLRVLDLRVDEGSTGVVVTGKSDVLSLRSYYPMVTLFVLKNYVMKIKTVKSTTTISSFMT